MASDAPAAPKLRREKRLKSAMGTSPVDAVEVVFLQSASNGCARGAASALLGLDYRSPAAHAKPPELSIMLYTIKYKASLAFLAAFAA